MAAGVPVKSCVIVQYVALRRDLLTTHKWPLGAVIAQACHACTAVMHTCRDDPQCQQYLTDLDRMHKVVVEVKDEEELCGLSRALQESDIAHHLWVEQPENWPTCVATKPYPKTEVHKLFRRFKLFS